jgi:hypothetical protein
VNRIVRTAGAALTAVSLIALSGCATGATGQPYAPTDGASVDTDDIALRNVQVITNGTGANVLIGSITNKTERPDALVGIEINERPILQGQAILPATGSVYFGSTDTEGIPFIGQHQAGTYIDVTFNFRNAGAVPAAAFVTTNTGQNGDAWEAATGLPRGVETPPAEAEAEAGEGGEGHSTSTTEGDSEGAEASA